MTRSIPCAIVLGGLALGGPSAIADHAHGMGMRTEPDDSTFAAGVTVLAAEFDTMNYGGDYQGVIPRLSWSRGRFGASANIALYRLQENGRSLLGLGDTMVSGSATLVSSDVVQLGVMAMVMAPTGAHRDGLGMGHMMAMPSVFAMYHLHPMTLTGSVGYGRALTTDMGHHSHGPWPLVDPMNMSEVMWSGGGDVSVVHTHGRGVTAGARLSGGIAVGESGASRMVGGVRVGWVEGTVSTGVELQAGLVGDPFTVRAVVDTTVSF